MIVTDLWFPFVSKSESLVALGKKKARQGGSNEKSFTSLSQVVNSGRRELKEVKLSDVDSSIGDEAKGRFGCLSFAGDQAKLRKEQAVRCSRGGGRRRDGGGNPGRREGSGGERPERGVSEDSGDDGGSDLDVDDGVRYHLFIRGKARFKPGEFTFLDDEMLKS